MAEITHTLNREASEVPSGYATLPSAPEPRNGQDFKIEADNPIKPTDAPSRWVVGAHTATYHCHNCNTSTTFELSVYGPKPKPICCNGNVFPHADFPY